MLMMKKEIDKTTKLAIEYVVEKYNPHTIIIYGSRARGDSTPESDVDIACFVDSTVISEDIRVFNDIFIDAGIFPTESMNNIDKFVKFNESFCALDTRNLGKQFLDKVHKKIQEGPNPLSNRDKQNIINLGLKALQQASINNIEGNYKRTRLQFDLLKTYFSLRDKWYFGPKQGFVWLKNNDKKAYDLFDNIYKNPQNVEALKETTNYIYDYE